MMRITTLLIGTLLALAPSAAATDVVLKNDSVVDGGQVAVQLGFVTGETGAAVLSASAGQYPVTLKDLQVFIEKSPLVAQTSMTVQLYVWSTATISGASPSLGAAVYTSPQLSFVAGGLNTWDVSASNLVMNGPFTVGCRIISTGSQFGLHSPNMVTDTNGCQGGKNWVRQTNGQWANLCSFGVSGDLVIRSTVTIAGGGTGQFINLGNGLAGNHAPVLTGSGSLAAGGNFSLTMTGLPTFTTTNVVVGFATLLAPFKGGVMGPTVDLVIPFGTGLGTVVLPATTPPGIPSGASIYVQSWTPDAGGPAGFDATNVLRCLFP